MTLVHLCHMYDYSIYNRNNIKTYNTILQLYFALVTKNYIIAKLAYATCCRNLKDSNTYQIYIFDISIIGILINMYDKFACIIAQTKT